VCVCVPLLPIFGVEKVRQLNQPSQVAFMRCVTVLVLLLLLLVHGLLFLFFMDP